MALLVFYVLFLTLRSDHSSALYCLCKDGVGDQALQKAIDNACFFGADCDSIKPNGTCYKPNTLKDHCNYVVNSYYQRMRSAGICDFAGAATTSPIPPSTTSGCVYPSNPSNAGMATLPPPIATRNNGTTTTSCISNSGVVVGPLQGTKTKLLLTLVRTTVWLALGC